jgi:cytochrome c-type biogenesis protein CcmH/NrfG
MMLTTSKMRLFAPLMLLGGITFGVCPLETQAPHWPANADHSKSGLIATKIPASEVLTAKHIEDAEARFNTILTEQPGDPVALADMGSVRIRQKNFIGAISYLERAQQTRPKDKTVAAALETARFWFYIDEGHHSLVSNELAAAERRYLSALELRPDSREAFMGLRTTLLKARRARRTMPPVRREVRAQALVQNATMSQPAAQTPVSVPQPSVQAPRDTASNEVVYGPFVPYVPPSVPLEAKTAAVPPAGH